ncbi:MAG: hypothetical protein H0T11_05675 [Chthoniobacterales bacterium]|nr:hypothetical protein [Chthoniobacterales bacterium]
MPTSLFDITSFGTLADHTVAGFDHPIPAICYSGEGLKSPFPVGGIATGYFEIKGDGTLGLSSLYNSYVPPMQLNGALLTLINADGTEKPLDGVNAEIAVLAHFPVLNMRFVTKQSGATIWLRAFTTILPGDSEGSNTPGVVFELTADRDVTIRFAMNVGHNVEAGVQPLELSKDLPGAGRRYLKGDDYRGSFVIALIGDIEEAVATAADDRASFTLTLPLKKDHSRRAVFAWHVPWWIDSGMEPHMNRYASWFKDAIDVAAYLREHHAVILKRILAWQSVVYQSGFPGWVSNALVQSLYSFAKNTVWVDEPREDRWYEPNGFFVHSESFRGCPISETMVCRQHGHLPILLLWPDLEKSTLAAFAHFQLRDGEVPFSFGQPTALRDPRFHCQHPLTASQFVQQIHRYFIRTGDIELLKRFWPNVVDAAKYMAFLDIDDDGLINEHPHALRGDNWPANQFYDQWPWHGTSSNVASQGLAALRSLAAMADHLENHDVHESASKLCAKGLASFREKLWNGSYFRLWYDVQRGPNETCLANQIMGQWCCWITNVEPLFTPEETKLTFATIEKFNAAPTKFGLINAGNFQGDLGEAGPPNFNFASMIFLGENLCAAMTGMYEGYAPAAEWARRLLWTVHEHEGMPFDQHCLIRADNGQPSWGADYYSNLIVWGLPMALQNIGLREFSAKDGFIARIVAAARIT